MHRPRLRALLAVPLFLGGYVLGQSLALPTLLMLVGGAVAVGAVGTLRRRPVAVPTDRPVDRYAAMYAEPVARVFNVGGETPAQYLEDTLVLRA